jgi:hypothetical protein
MCHPQRHKIKQIQKSKIKHQNEKGKIKEN